MVTALVAILRAARNAAAPRISARAAGEAHEPPKPMHVPRREIPLVRRDSACGRRTETGGFSNASVRSRVAGSGSSRVRSRPAVDGRGEGRAGGRAERGLASFFRGGTARRVV